MSDIDNAVYEYVLNVAVEEAKAILDEFEGIKEDEDRFHDILFDRTLVTVDELGHYDVEARDISEICGDVESDIIHGDILGL